MGRGSRKAKFDGTEISFSDDGGGIAEGISEFLFDPFFTTKESSSGSGFGLYNSKLFMEDHNGEIGFSSTLGQGTTFYLFLPLADLDEKKKEFQRPLRGQAENLPKKKDRKVEQQGFFELFVGGGNFPFIVSDYGPDITFRIAQDHFTM